MSLTLDALTSARTLRALLRVQGDMGGQRTLQRKWTSFMKARLDCSFPELSLPPIVQDVFLLKDDDWRRSIFYAVFTSQSYVPFVLGGALN